MSRYAADAAFVGSDSSSCSPLHVNGRVVAGILRMRSPRGRRCRPSGRLALFFLRGEVLLLRFLLLSSSPPPSSLGNGSCFSRDGNSGGGDDGTQELVYAEIKVLIPDESSQDGSRMQHHPPPPPRQNASSNFDEHLSRFSARMSLNSSAPALARKTEMKLRCFI